MAWNSNPPQMQRRRATWLPPSRSEEMVEFQSEHETELGLQFINWHNATHRTHFNIQKTRCDGASRLMFRDRGRRLEAHIVTLFYDTLTTRFKWMGAADGPGAPRSCLQNNSHAGLARCINNELAAICVEAVGDHAVLLVCVLPTVTTVTGMLVLLDHIVVPRRQPFEGIYMFGRFSRSRRKRKAELEVRQIA